MAAVAPWEKGHGISIAGDLTWAGGRLSLDGATIGFDGRGAKGSLTFATLHGRALTEGTLAYDTLEWMPAAQGRRNWDRQRDFPASGADPSRLWRRGPRGFGYADFRRAFPGRSLRGWAACAGAHIASGSRQRRHRGVGDFRRQDCQAGSITIPGIQTHSRSTQTAATSIRRLSASAWPIAVERPRECSPGAGSPLQGWPRPLQKLKAATGSFGIVFPAGGTLDGEVAKRLSEVFALGKSPWELNSGSIAFTAASMEGAVTTGGVALKLDSEAGGNRIAGSLRIATPGGQIAGKLTVSPDE